MLCAVVVRSCEGASAALDGATGSLASPDAPGAAPFPSAFRRRSDMGWPLEMPSLPEHMVLGFDLKRRTLSNNMMLCMLADRPCVLRPSLTSPVVYLPGGDRSSCLVFRCNTKALMQ